MIFHKTLKRMKSPIKFKTEKLFDPKWKSGFYIKPIPKCVVEFYTLFSILDFRNTKHTCIKTIKGNPWHAKCMQIEEVSINNDF